jgi:hypothetical protein
MPTQERMNLDERLKYLRLQRPHYLKADKRGRGILLDEMEKVTHLGRTTLIRHMKGNPLRKQRSVQRGRTYDHRVDDVLRVIAESLDYITAERLKPNLLWTAECLARHGELSLDPEVASQLEKISVSTLGRILKRLRQDEHRLPQRKPQAASGVLKNIPMQRIAWNQQQPGHFEADLVHHCGSVAQGEYGCTLQLIDVATGWSERVAILGRSYLVMQDAFQHIAHRVLFPILEIHPDNGSEFLNAHLVHFWHKLIKGVTLSRSRPWQKNDNRCVEQKNNTLVRAYLGHERLDSVAQIMALNALYEDMWAYYNFFQPVMRLAHKTAVEDASGHTRIRRTFDQARTPFQRLCDTGVLSHDAQATWIRWRDQINPRQLRQSIYLHIHKLFELPNAVPGVPEEVRSTLRYPIPA